MLLVEVDEASNFSLHYGSDTVLIYITYTLCCLHFSPRSTKSCTPVCVSLSPGGRFLPFSTEGKPLGRALSPVGYSVEYTLRRGTNICSDLSDRPCIDW